MSFSVYEIVIPSMVHGLNVLRDYLDHAQHWETERGLEAGAVLGARLAPDMISFGEQFSVVCDKVELHVAQLGQKEAPDLRPAEVTYPGLTGRLASLRAELEGIDPSQLAGAQSHTYELKPPIIRGWFGGDDYIRHLVMPDFFFHIAIVHAILRHLGAHVGKRDYLGNLAQQSGGDYS
jgi:uncharacterized protein